MPLSLKPLVCWFTSPSWAPNSPVTGSSLAALGSTNPKIDLENPRKIEVILLYVFVIAR